ncbi:YaeQ family protein [Marinimicrobium alkaliphilum]|uniref:YaeQ family protein n=1 Tax=Marinimicrobium alkaliphilum TaxID=2202654 RepID=UPI000DB9196A|nr:YaeQ family protein [Marinimicrobium alkaliphilum]
MALKSTILKARLDIADMDRGYYQTHDLTLAQHPSENDRRVMVRLLAFALNASEDLAFTSGLSGDDEEPELADKDLTGAIRLWVAFGTPDEKWLRKASRRAGQVKLYTYGQNSVPVWWQQNRELLSRLKNLEVWQLPEEPLDALALLVSRNMQLQFSVSDGEVWVSGDEHSAPIGLEQLQ